MALALLCLISIALSGCVQDRANDHSIVCLKSEYGAYPDALPRALPAYSVVVTQGNDGIAFPSLEEGNIAEAFDAQALPALHKGVADYWYPHYLATAVIAVNRDETDVEIGGWRDLPAAGEDVYVYHDTYINRQMLIPAIAYGLEGESFTLSSAAALLDELDAMDRFVEDAGSAPVIICYDYQAAAMIKSGRNIEIIVPGEGTLSYAKGLLSHDEIIVDGELDALLLAAGYRLAGGRCDEPLAALDYGSAHEIQDYEHFNAITQSITRVLRRDVLHTRLYNSADALEHQFFALLYIILVVSWVASFIHRSTQKGVRRAALLTGIILLGWMIVRLVKYQLIVNTIFNRYLWYGFYLFQLSLPLVLLWLAWAIDQSEDLPPTPKWLRAAVASNAALLLLVFTNDLHNWVFRLDLSNPFWASDYGYGIGYYFVLAGSILPLLAAIGIMLTKNWRNPRKRGFLYPLAFVLLLAIYGYGYITRIPFMWQSDFTMMIGLFTLLFVEACLRSGMIPVNTKYAALFTHSPLHMQIIDSAGNVALRSASALQCDHDLLTCAIKSHPKPILQDENTFLFAAEIAGGTVLWQEDITALNHLRAEVEESVRKLTATNAVLAEEEKIKRAMDEENAKTQLMTQLEDEIAGYTAKLSSMIANLGNAADQTKETARIALLLCYVKRRCNLFFAERETEELPADELAVYMDELCEIAEYSDVKIIVTSEIKAPMAIRGATLFYDFFYQVVDWAQQECCSTMLVHMGLEKDHATLRLLPSADARTFAPDAQLSMAIASVGGAYSIKDLDDAVGISLSFPKGGEGGG